ncbi:DUF561 domain-containing protein [uncultured Vagococcus sp.]|uniref:DUF561 domain-containing protein n=1 Tax=uncultured Vagococcus sp. TaxID=189676 RepID=UPI0028D6ACC3|nr:DUF561 domain-containing protein [uncultured Vagococcus sp.]
MKSICDLLGIRYPLFQGAMAEVARYELVSAVSNAGGLGILASGGLSADQLREQIRACKERTTSPFAVNLMLMMPNLVELIAVVIEEDIKVVTTGAGTPKPYMSLLKEAGIKVIPVVPSVKIAKKMEGLGVAAIIAEGTESGGHVGETTTMALVPQVAQAVSLPVIAAGGIADGHGVAAAFALGAQGVQLGTLFLTALECPVPLSVKQVILAADDTSTIVTGRNRGVPVRSIKNKMIQEYQALEVANGSRDELEALALGSLRKAMIQGDVENGSVMAGQIAGMIRGIRPVQVIIEGLFVEANQVIASLKSIN